MYNRSMADNHLSKIASKGRFGDTKIAKSKFVEPGALWHVNEGEKKAMSLYGAEGEKLVDAIGSGSINPETGLKENFVITTGMVMAGAAIGSAVIGGISALSGAKSAKNEERASNEGLQQLQGVEESLEGSVQKKRDAAMLDYETDLENISSQTGMKKEDLQQQTQQAIHQSGMATSGTVETKRSQMWNRIEGSFGRGREGLMATLGKKMGDVEGWYEGEKARITSEKNKFEQQRDLAREQQKGLFG